MNLHDAISVLSDSVRRLDAGLQGAGRAWGKMDVLWQTLQKDAATVRKDATQLGATATQALHDLAALPRASRVAAAFAPAVLAQRIHLGRRTRATDPDALDAEFDIAQAKRIAAACKYLGGGVLKVGQILSARPDLLSPAYINALAQLQDDAQPLHAAVAKAELEATYGAELSTVFATFESKPIAAASVAQVHAATLPDGRRVVVKLRRPGIRSIVSADLRGMKHLLNTLEPAIRRAMPPEVLAEIERMVLAECDFTQELAALTRAGLALAHRDNVQVPAPIPHLCHDNVLVMTHEEGVNLATYLSGADKTARDAVLTELIDLFAEAVLVTGEFHADPHPGNILVTPTGGVTLLDFGAAAVLPVDIRRHYVQATMAAVGANPKQAAEHLVALGFTSDPEEAERFAAAVLAQLHADAESIGDDTFDAVANVNALIGLARDFPDVVVPDHMVHIARVFATLGGLYLRYRPDVPAAKILMRHLVVGSASTA